MFCLMLKLHTEACSCAELQRDRPTGASKVYLVYYSTKYCIFACYLVLINYQTSEFSCSSFFNRNWYFTPFYARKLLLRFVFQIPKLRLKVLKLHQHYFFHKKYCKLLITKFTEKNRRDNSEAPLASSIHRVISNSRFLTPFPIHFTCIFYTLRTYTNTC